MGSGMSPYFTPIPFSLWTEAPQTFADRLGQSFRETGFAVVEDHPLSSDLIEQAMTATRSFFDLPEATKRTYFDADGGGQRGYTPFAMENAKDAEAADLKEFWHTGRFMPPEAPFRDVMTPTPSVKEVPGFDDATRAFFDALDEFGACLLRSVAIHLELDQSWFTHRINWGNSILRLLHYPPQATPPPAGTVRAGAHEDINVITLLLGAEEAGLEVLHRSGDWLPVNPPPGALVINCGDMLQRLTGGILPSTTHRVVNPAPERARFPRYSTPFFLHFNPDVVIETLPGCLAEGGQSAPPITAMEYLLERLREIGLIRD